MKAPTTKRKAGIAALLWLLLALAASPADYAVDWFTVDGGGGTSQGGAYALTGTLGQPDAGQMSGGRFSLTGGFWGMVRVIQTPGAPRLTITHTNGMATVSWPFPSPGFGLEVTSDLSPPRQWTPVTLPYQSSATRIWITVPAAVGHQFYRLHKP
jgi:hypothetical protein